MSRFAALAVVVAVMSLFDVELRADEIAGTIKARKDDARRTVMIETTLSAWLRAAKECRSYDAKFTRWEYDPVFGDATKPTNVAQGRFLFQRDGSSCYDIPASNGLIWRDDEYGIIERKEKTYKHLHGADLVAVRKRYREPVPRDLVFWASLARGLSIIPYFEQSDAMPHLLATDHAQLRADYDFRLTDWSPNRIVLTGILKSGWYSGRTVFHRIDFAFSDGRPLPYAMRVDQGFGRQTVYEFHDPLINKTAPDAEKFLKPDLTGLKRIDLGEGPSKRR